MSEAVTVGVIGAGAAIVGGIVAGVLSGAYQHFRDWLTRPKLELAFEDMGPANVIEAEWREGDKNIGRVIVRVGVRNTGKRAANGCRVYLVKVEEVQPSGGITATNFHDSMQLPWAGSDFRPKDVPRQIAHYIDVVRVRKDVSGWEFAFERPLSSHEKLRNYSGTYRFAIVATADNAEPARCSIDVSYNQDWHNLRALKHG